MSVMLNTVVASFAIIEKMAEVGSAVGVSELARLLDVRKPLVFRHLRTLRELGYVAQDPITEKYSLTPRLFHIGHAIAGKNDFLSAARRVMPELAAAARLSVSVSRIEEKGVRVLDILEFRSTIEISTPPGSLFDFFTSAQGKVAMAFLPDLMAAQIGANGSIRTEHGRDIDTAVLREELAQVRAQGWAISAQEVLPGVNALAAPIFDGKGALTGTIAVIGSIQAIPSNPPLILIEALVSASQKISEQLGLRKGEEKK